MHTKLIKSFPYPHKIHLEWLKSCPYIHIQGIPLETIEQQHPYLYFFSNPGHMYCVAYAMYGIYPPGLIACQAQETSIILLKSFEVVRNMSISSDSISHKVDTFSGIMLISRSTKFGPISCVVYGVYVSNPSIWCIPSLLYLFHLIIKYIWSGWNHVHTLTFKTFY